MKATRILLFLSPLLWFVPPLVPVDESNTGLFLLNYMYRGLIGTFPGNALMAFLCYTYARQLGREGWPWVVGSLRFPFLAPFILAFVPAKYGSVADEQRRAAGRVERSIAASGPFDARFPLLAAYLSSKPQETGAEAKARMDPVKGNFEFSAFVDPNGLNALTARAVAEKLTLWTTTEDTGFRVFGSGMVEPKAVADLTNFLRNTAPTKKLATAVHPAEGPTKYFEYYPRTD